MRPIEFYTTPEGEVTLREVGEAERQLKESDTEFVQTFLGVVREFYPEAHKALMELYSKSAANKRYRDYLAVRRFIKCNFGVYDNTIDVDASWGFKFEFVSCPLRGECKWDGVLCQPKFCSTLSSRQLEVMEMCYNGASDEQIAERLCTASWAYTAWQSSSSTQRRIICLTSNNLIKPYRHGNGEKTAAGARADQQGERNLCGDDNCNGGARRH